jgi:hypothetical protein
MPEEKGLPFEDKALMDWENEGGALTEGEKQKKLDTYAELYYPEQLGEITAAQELVDAEHKKHISQERASLADQRANVTEQIANAQERLDHFIPNQAKKSEARDMTAHKRVRFIQSRIDQVTDDQIDVATFETQENTQAEVILGRIDQEAFAAALSSEDFQAILDKKDDPHAYFAALRAKHSDLNRSGVAISQTEWDTLCSYFVRTDLNDTLATYQRALEDDRKQIDYERNYIQEMTETKKQLGDELKKLASESSLLPETRAFYEKISQEYQRDLAVSTVEGVVDKYNVFFFHGIRTDRSSLVEMLKTGTEHTAYSVSTLRQGDTSENVYRPMGLLVKKGEIQDAFNRDVLSELQGARLVSANTSKDVSRGTGRLADQVAEAEESRHGQGGKEKWNEYFVGTTDFLGEEKAPLEFGGMLFFIDEFADETENRRFNVNQRPQDIAHVMPDITANGLPIYVWKEGKMYKGTYDEEDKKLSAVGEPVDPKDITK